MDQFHQYLSTDIFAHHAVPAPDYLSGFGDFIPQQQQQSQYQHQHLHRHHPHQIHHHSSHPVTVKMEDIAQHSRLHTPGSAGSTPQPASTPSASQQQQPKKRKSWGQVLPEPKTNLPPRKRAKTEDEKEQRRIERVKRNRLAAHNSRERKRQEVESLQVKKEDVDRKNSELEAKVNQMAKIIEAYKKACPHINIDIDSTEFTFEPTQGPSTPESFTTINPRKASYTTPETSPSLGSMDSPAETSTGPSTPMMEHSLNEPDMTQHSAAMLCDLQCQSVLTRWLLPTLLALMITLSTFRLHSLLKISTTSSTLTRWADRRLPASWRPRAASLKTRGSHQTSSVTPTSSLTSWTQSPLACTPNQAQQILLATILALQPSSSSNPVSRAKCGVVGEERLGREFGKGLTQSRKGSQRSSSIGIQSWGQQGRPRKAQECPAY